MLKIQTKIAKTLPKNDIIMSTWHRKT